MKNNDIKNDYNDNSVIKKKVKAMKKGKEYYKRVEEHVINNK